MEDDKLREKMTRMKALIRERMNQSREGTAQQNESERWYHKGRYESYAQVLAMFDTIGIR